MCREGKEEWMPIDFTPYCSTAGYDAVSPVFQEVLADLYSLNISVEQVREETSDVTDHHQLDRITLCFIIVIPLESCISVGEKQCLRRR